MSGKISVIRIAPYQYIHVLDNNTGVTRVEIGPQTFTRKEHEVLVFGPEAMITLPPRHYCTIQNPAVRDDQGRVVLDEYDQVKLRHEDYEIRYHEDWTEPFPLMFGERLIGQVTQFTTVPHDAALRLVAVRPFVDSDEKGKSVERKVGDEWLFLGPKTYKPRVEVKVLDTVTGRVIKANTALKLRAKKDCTDCNGTQRVAGEEWLVRQQGAYLPAVDEEIVEVIKARTITDRKALHLRATRTFTDVYGKKRRAGEEWLVVFADSRSHIPDVYEELVGEVHITTLSKSDYCVVLDPVDSQGRPQLGKKELRQGEISFFLQPGESLEDNRIKSIYVLGEEEALLLKARELLQDEEGTQRRPGDRWMIYGPRKYCPPVEIEVVEQRRMIPLDENEGIYVRDINSGQIRSVCGQTYMLKPSEELWKKELPTYVEQLLDRSYYSGPDSRNKAKGSNAVRDPTRVVSYRVPHNAAVQVFNYKTRQSRVKFGPDLVMLDPDEHFSVVHLSGDKPKRPNAISSLSLMLGPDFMTDILIVETSDHARLSLQLAYNWHFDVDKTDEKSAAKIFQVRDFVGDACKAIASRVRGAVASRSFDEFHKHSTRIIRSALFGVEEDGKVGDSFTFLANNLVITNIDIQSVEPVDQRTRDALQKSVQLAIEITTNSQEASATHEAARLEQQARGALERQKINDQADAESSRKNLLQLRSESNAVETCGQAIAEAQARAESAQIEGQAAVQEAKLRAEAAQIEAESRLQQLKQKHTTEIEHKRARDELEVNKKRELARIEAEKFRQTVEAIGPDTIEAIALAGPELQAKLLQGLGLKGFLITDGNSPINLFNTANGLVGGPGMQGSNSS